MNHNGIDLKNSILDFVRDEPSVAVFAPYIKTDMMEKILSEARNCRYVVLRWEPKDLLTGASDIGVYHLCRKHRIPVFRNSRLHLKLYLSENSAYLTTANISERAMADQGSELFNYELGTRIESLSFEDRLYLQKIVDSSILLDDDIVEEIERQLEAVDSLLDLQDFTLDFGTDDKDFLLSSLPMSEDLEELIRFYREKKAPRGEKLDCLVHDLSLYNIPSGLSEENCRNLLRERFFRHEFIRAFLDELEMNEGELYFGHVRRWIADNCADCPTPRPFEVTKNVQILYHWFDELGEGEFTVSVPGTHSQRIRWNKW